MGTTVDIVIDYLKNLESDSFSNIYDNLKVNKISEWEKYGEQNNISLNDLEIKKRGELYKILTLSGQFIRVSNTEWSYEFSTENKYKKGE